MTIQSIMLLNSLASFVVNEETIISFLENTSNFCYVNDLNKTLDYSKYSHEIHGLIKYLVDEGCLEYAYENNTNFFKLTHKGLHRHQITIQNALDFLCRSIIVPIVVSLATTLLTLWLNTL